MAPRQKEEPARLENIAAEQMVLGKLLQSESAYWATAETLQAAHFAKPVHQRIFQAIKDILTEGKRLSVALLEARLGPEYDDDQKSTASLLTALLRDAENNEDALDQVEILADLYRRRRLIAFHEEGLRSARNAASIATDLLHDAEVKLDDIASNADAEPFISLGQYAATAAVKSKTAQLSGRVPGVDTGLPSLDEIMKRMHPGDLIAIGAKPGDGKTILASQLAARASIYGPVLFFQLEMQAEDLARRALAAESNMSVAQIEEGSYNFEEAAHLQTALENLKGSRVYIEDRPKLALERMRDKALQLKRRHGLSALVIDHMRLVRVFKARDKFERMEIVCGGIKAMAKELEVPAILLSQVTRASQRRDDDPVPRLDDFDGGGALDQDADIALALFRRDRWLQQREPAEPADVSTVSKERREWAEKISACRGKVEIWVRKLRRGEDNVMRNFWFDGRRSMIKEIDK